MKDQIALLVSAALEQVKREHLPDLDLPDTVTVEHARDPRHGDFASNVALTLAKRAGTAPRALAERIVAALPHSDLLDEVQIAGPGFINFRLRSAVAQQLVFDILGAGEAFGRSDAANGSKVIVEFVSANPTGPLHVGHGRGAAYGASVAALLEAVGHEVHREYYVNDAGRQMDILAASVWLRYLEAGGMDVPFPQGGYQGDYVREVAAELRDGHEGRFEVDRVALLADLPPDERDGGSKDAFVDALIGRARDLLGGDSYELVHAAGLDSILADIRADLAEFGVEFDRWFSERSLTSSGTVDQALERLVASGNTFEQDGALWFRASQYGDDKDRVLVRANGQRTYIASDIAYHLDKRLRGFDTLCDVLGADHHGYVARVRAGLEAMGQPGDSLEVQLVQFVSLYEGGEKISMTTRGGQFVTLRELRQQVGNDAARFFYVMRSNDQHLDFDLELAKSKRDDNPVFYIQYAHARTCSVMRQLVNHELPFDADVARASLERLVEDKETSLLRALGRYPEIVALAARDRAPQTVVHYLRELTADYHSFYNGCRIMLDHDAELRNARAALNLAVGQVIRNGLGLLGVTAPERM